MASAPGPVLILVCPTCSKKYRGNPEKPDGRYQCPDDQATLTKYSPVPPAPPIERKADPPPSRPDFSVNSQQDASDTHRDFAPTIRVESAAAPVAGYADGRDPLLASAHDDLAPDEIARRAADALHEQGTKSGAIDQTVFAGSETVPAAVSVPTPLPTPTPYVGVPTPPPMPAPDSATVLAASRTYSAQEVPTGYAAATKMSQTPTQFETPMLTEEGTFPGFAERRSVVAVMTAAVRPKAADAMSLLSGKC